MMQRTLVIEMNKKRREEQGKIIELFEALHKTERDFFDYLYEDGVFVGIKEGASPEMANISGRVVELYQGLLFTKSEGLEKNIMEVGKHGRIIAGLYANDQAQAEWRALSKAVSLLMADLYMIGSNDGFAQKLDAVLAPAEAEGWFDKLKARFGC